MKKGSVHIHYLECDNLSELDPCDRELLEYASRVTTDAYAPYSGFQVGAAVKLGNGKIVTGNNQENAAYPSGLCAERVAMFAASAQYPGIPMTVIAITAKSKDFLIDYPVPPCGACRQVMAEYENHYNNSFRLILRGESGKIRIFTNVGSILPFGFDAVQLKRK